MEAELEKLLAQLKKTAKSLVDKYDEYIKVEQSLKLGFQFFADSTMLSSEGKTEAMEDISALVARNIENERQIALFKLILELSVNPVFNPTTSQKVIDEIKSFLGFAGNAAALLAPPVEVPINVSEEK